MADGAGAAGGVATISPSTETTISTAIRTSIAATGPRIRSRAGGIAATSAALAALAGLVELAGLADRAVLVELEVLAALGVRVELVGLVVQAASVGLAAEIAFPPCRVGAATDGNTIPSIAAGLPTKTGLLRTALAARRVAILSPSDKRAPGNKLAGRAATSPVPAAEPVSAIAPAAMVSATGVEPA